MQTKVEKGIRLRSEVKESDRDDVRALLLSTGIFYPHEIKVAIELIDDRLAKGTHSEYHFIFADGDKGLKGYICYGPITMTIGRFDIHWIAVRKDSQQRGIGSMLLKEAERDILSQGGRFIFVETSSRPDYASTRAFYRSHDYGEVARIPDYYAEGDDKVIFMKALEKLDNPEYLRAPDIFFTILEKGKDKLVRLGDIAEIRFGIKTGANEFFYVEDITDLVEDG